VSEEPDEETIKRRSENAGTGMGCLGETPGYACIVSSLALIALPATTLLR